MDKWGKKELVVKALWSPYKSRTQQEGGTDLEELEAENGEGASGNIRC